MFLVVLSLSLIGAMTLSEGASVDTSERLGVVDPASVGIIKPPKPDCQKRCCPKAEYLVCPQKDQCKIDADCPDGSVCCDTAKGCPAGKVCVKPVDCCCPVEPYSPVCPAKHECRSDSDCKGNNMKCCASICGPYNICRPAGPCPCEKDMKFCCEKWPILQFAHMECNACKSDEVCPMGHGWRCCPDQKGCTGCVQAKLCG